MDKKLIGYLIAAILAILAIIIWIAGPFGSNS